MLSYVRVYIKSPLSGTIYTNRIDTLDNVHCRAERADYGYSYVALFQSLSVNPTCTRSRQEF